MTQPKPPGPRVWFLYESVSEDEDTLTAVRMQPGEYDQYANMITVIEKTYADNLEAELREAKAKCDFSEVDWERIQNAERERDALAKEVKEIKASMRSWEVAKEIEILANSDRQWNTLIEECDRYRATSELKLGELELLAKLEQVEKERDVLKAQDLTHAVIAADVKLREEREALTKQVEDLQKEVAALRDRLRIDAPFPTCGRCSGDLALRKRSYKINQIIRQEMTEFWECPKCAGTFS